MNPEQKIKFLILTKAVEMGSTVPAFGYDASTVDSAYDALVEADEHWDAQSEVREGEVGTNITAPWSRNYESNSVAAKLPDRTWVGWTYWYGGGKHAEPEAIDWMDEAYDLTCEEEQKVMTVRTFAKLEQSA